MFGIGVLGVRDRKCLLRAYRDTYDTKDRHIILLIQRMIEIYAILGYYRQVGLCPSWVFVQY